MRQHRGHIVTLGPTVGFLAALRLIADGRRRDGLFDAVGALTARAAAAGVRVRGRGHGRTQPRRDDCAADARGVRDRDADAHEPEAHVYACSHLANSASLLLPVSNLTNLLAFHASGLSFARLGALMALPTTAAVAVEWVVLRRRSTSRSPLNPVRRSADAL